MKRTRVLHVFGILEHGGAQIRTFEVLRHLQREVEADFCVLSASAGSAESEADRLGSRILRCKLGVLFPIRLARVLWSGKYDAIHSHIHHSSGIILLLAMLARTPRVRIAHFRSSDDGRRPTLARRAMRRLFKFFVDLSATKIIGVSESALDGAWPKWRGDARCEVIYNGIDLTNYSIQSDPEGVRSEFGYPQSSNIYIHVGRFDPAKNHLRLASIFREIAIRDSDSRFLLIGEGNNQTEASVRLFFQESGLLSRVTFAGVRSDVPRLLRASNIMIFPSVWEGLPGAVLEACAAGTPVLATDLPGILEIKAHHRSVRTCKLQQTDFEWADAAVSLAASKFHEQERRFAEEVFSLGSCAQKLLMTWQQDYPRANGG